MKKVFFALLLAAISVANAMAQATKIDATKLLKPGGNSTFLLTNGSGAVVWGNAATLLTAGTGISISGNTVTNSAPDQTVVLTAGSGIGVSGTYPSFTLTATDASTTNEIQTLSAGDGSGSDKTLLLSLSGGTVTLKPGTGITLSRSGNDITIAATTPTVTISRYEEITSTAATTITVTGFTPGANDTFLFVDGVYMDVGTGEDATLSGSTYTFTNALAIGQKVVVRKITL